jgi:hypothetical protein
MVEFADRSSRLTVNGHRSVDAGNRNNSRRRASMAYYAVHRRPQRTMTELEQAKVLKVTGEHARGFRDHVLFALALGTGLREHEALARYR